MAQSLLICMFSCFLFLTGFSFYAGPISRGFYWAGNSANSPFVCLTKTWFFVVL